MTADPNEHIVLNVKGSDNKVIQFKIRKSTTFEKLMKVYCERKGIPMDKARFYFNAIPVNKQYTPETLEMEEGDTMKMQLSS